MSFHWLTDVPSPVWWWCAMQITLIATVAIGVSYRTISRSPLLTRTAMNAAAVSMLVLSLSVPLTLEPLRGTIGRLSIFATEPSKSSVFESAKSTSAGMQSDSPQADFYVTAEGLLAALRSGLDRPVPMTSRLNYSNVISLLACGSIAIGMLQFLCGYFSAVRLRRSSVLIDKADVCNSIGTPRNRRWLFGKVNFAESDAITSAAVVGVFKHTVLLPANWRHWSSAEQRAVIAHELAHVAGRDPLWRMIICGVRVMHFYNPLVHLFFRRMVLTHEVVADLRAVSAMDKRDYVRSLSKIALRRDQMMQGRSLPMFTPVFTGYLIRRIKMLHKMNVSVAGTTTASSRGGVIAAAVCVTLSLFAARCIAQPPSTSASNEPAVRVATRSNATRNTSEPTSTMFRRGKTDPDSIPFNEVGMAEMRIGEFLRLPESEGITQAFNRYVATLGSETDSSVEPFDASAVETIVGKGYVQITPLEPGHKDGHTTAMSYGMQNEVYLTFNRSVNAKRWAKNIWSDATDRQVTGIDCVAVSNVPVFAPADIVVAQPTPRKAVIGGMAGDPIRDDSTETENEAFVTAVHHTSSTNESQWASAYRKVSGGLMTLASTTQKIRFPELPENPTGEQTAASLAAKKSLQELLSATEVIAAGVDFDLSSNRLGLRVCFQAADKAGADRIESELKSLLRYHHDSLRQKERDGELLSVQPQQVLYELVANSVCERKSDDIHQVMVQTAADYEGLANVLFASIMSYVGQR